MPTPSNIEQTYLSLQLHQQLRDRIAQVAQGGSERSRQRHRPWTPTPRERVRRLLDPGSPFLEIGSLAAFEMYDGDAPAAGLIAGIGIVEGRYVMVVCNDSTVKGGTYYPITVKKHLRAQEIAFENRLPCLYLVDSGGAFLPRQDEVFPDRDHFGRIFYNQSQLSSRGIPQISAVLGSSTAGGAYVPAMSDESVIVRNQGTIFLGGPPLVKAATGEIVTSEELGGAEVHTTTSGVADHIAENDDHALQIVRNIVATLPPTPQRIWKKIDALDPSNDPEDIAGILPVDVHTPYDVREIISRIIDAGSFHEFKENYGTTLVTGFARVDGHPVGIIANNGILFSESSLKGAHFIELADQRGIPLLFLQNISGFMVGKDYEAGASPKMVPRWSLPCLQPVSRKSPSLSGIFRVRAITRCVDGRIHRAFYSCGPTPESPLWAPSGGQRVSYGQTGPVRSHRPTMVCRRRIRVQTTNLGSLQ